MVNFREGVKHPWDYLWSSARYHVGLVDKDPLVAEEDLLSDIDDWRLFLSQEDVNLDFLREKTRTGRPCGNEGFDKKAEGLTGRLLCQEKLGSKSKC